MEFQLPIDYTTLTVKQRKLVREQYIKQQDGLCAYCRKPLDMVPVTTFIIDKDLFPIGFFNTPIHLHHNHETGMTIGAVHAKCNAIAWQYFGE